MLFQLYSAFRNDHPDIVLQTQIYFEINLQVS